MAGNGEAEAKLAELIRVGQLMSNLCHNYVEFGPGRGWSTRLGNAQQEWDKARNEYRAAMIVAEIESGRAGEAVNGQLAVLIAELEKVGGGAPERVCTVPLDGPSAMHSEMAEAGDLEEHIAKRHTATPTKAAGGEE